MIALAHFLRTGEFGALKIGDSRARIAELLGDPPLWGAQPKKENAEIWKYGAFEFYFQNHALWMIFTDETKAYSLGKNALQIDDFEAGMTLDAARENLRRHDIHFREGSWPWYEGGWEIICESGVSLRFGVEDEQGLFCICLR